MSTEEKKAGKGEKDKRPVNAYILYMKKVRNDVKSKNPELNNKELVKKISDMWKELSEAEKKVYLDLQNELKLNYQQLHANDKVEKKKPKKFVEQKPVPKKKAPKV